MNYIGRFIFAVIILMIGNYLGDQATLRDCATKGSAVMLGGGTVVCTVEKK